MFGYFIVFPWGFKFFLGFADEHIRALPSMREYLGFSAKLLLAFGLVFELPLVITFLAKLGLVSVDFLKKNRKYALLLFFAGAAINLHTFSIQNYGNASAFYLNFGGLAYITNEIRWGFSISNINRASIGNEDDQIPMVFATGFSYDLI